LLEQIGGTKTNHTFNMYSDVCPLRGTLVLLKELAVMGANANVDLDGAAVGKDSRAENGGGGLVGRGCTTQFIVGEHGPDVAEHDGIVI
jgi:hypothetical protein